MISLYYYSGSVRENEGIDKKLPGLEFGQVHTLILAARQYYMLNEAIVLQLWRESTVMETWYIKHNDYINSRCQTTSHKLKMDFFSLWLWISLADSLQTINTPAEVRSLH